MLRSPRLVRWLAALVILTSTPGLGELVESVLHMAIGDADDLDHHESDGCNDACATRGCTQGLFHTCRCNAPAVALPAIGAPRPSPSEAATERIAVSPTGQDLAGHRTPPFRPPSV